MKNLNLIAPINDLGYGITGKYLAHELQNLCEVSLYPMPNPIIKENDVCIPNLQKSIWNARENPKCPDFNAPCMRIWHQFEMAQMVGRGPHVGFPIFELDTFTERELHHLKSLDRIFVPSEWAKQVIHNNGIDVPTDVIPLGVDIGIFYPQNLTTFDSTTRFLSIGKTEVRKGHDVLHLIFNKAFTPNDNVELIVMWDNPFLEPHEKAEWEQFYLLTEMGRAGKIKFVPRVETAQEVAQVMAQVDCGVFLSRGEGWNLEALEMMAMGKQVIVTDYSAHTEFCNKENSKLVHVTNTEPAYDGKWFFGQGNWAKIEEDQVQQSIQHMRDVYDASQAGFENHTQLINKAGIETAQQFTWKNSAQRIMEALWK